MLAEQMYSETLTPEKEKQLLDRVEVERHRKELKTPWGAPVMISYDHIERHLPGSGVIGASITAWESPETMLLDPSVWEFVQESVASLDKNIKPGEATVFKKEMSFFVGKECIVPIEELPQDKDWWVESREGYYINVTNAKAPETKHLQLMMVRDKRHPAQFLLHSAWAGSIDSPQGTLANPDWKRYAFYYENR